MSDANRQLVFRCPSCGQRYGDPLYHGPVGHAPQNLCLDCWVNEWAEIEARMLRGGDWSALDMALWLVCNGYTRSQAAEIIGVTARTIRRWFSCLQRSFREFPDWMSGLGSSHVLTMGGPP